MFYLALRFRGDFCEAGQGVSLSRKSSPLSSLFRASELSDGSRVAVRSAQLIYHSHELNVELFLHLLVFQ